MTKFEKGLARFGSRKMEKVYVITSSSAYSWNGKKWWIGDAKEYSTRAAAEKDLKEALEQKGLLVGVGISEYEVEE